MQSSSRIIPQHDRHGLQARRQPEDGLAALNVPICEVGGATGVGTIMKAIRGAYEVANSL